METMTPRERFGAVMSFQPFDRLPMIEWAPYWGATLDRWRTEGMPEDAGDLNEFFGLEWYPRDWLCALGPYEAAYGIINRLHLRGETHGS